jgi:hypothetical protein
MIGAASVACPAGFFWSPPMVDSLAMILLYGLALYVLLGVATSVAFVLVGVTRMLPASASVTPGARILLLPGAAALWPYVLFRWLKSGAGR